MKKDQIDIINDEQRQIRRLEKIEQLYADLKRTKAGIQSKNESLGALTEKAKQSFAKFNEVRGFNLEAIKAELIRK